MLGSLSNGHCAIALQHHRQAGGITKDKNLNARAKSCDFWKLRIQFRRVSRIKRTEKSDRTGVEFGEHTSPSSVIGAGVIFAFIRVQASRSAYGMRPLPNRTSEKIPSDDVRAVVPRGKPVKLISTPARPVTLCCIVPAMPAFLASSSKSPRFIAAR